ncbi:hypothetical protein AKG34_08885 [Peribacillus butanolivorans]|nr:hypothetical protein AKG34_08885 [Peribacillus butanolivorans]
MMNIRIEMAATAKFRNNRSKLLNPDIIVTYASPIVVMHFIPISRVESESVKIDFPKWKQTVPKRVVTIRNKINGSPKFHIKLKDVCWTSYGCFTASFNNPDVPPC